MKRKRSIRKSVFPCVGIVVFILLPASAAAAVLHVPSEYPGIQSAINAASSGDMVCIADGEYNEWNLDFKGKPITVESANGPRHCIINCNGKGSGFYFHTREGVSSRISGITITNGRAPNGGGIICQNASPLIENCIIKANKATPFLLLGGLGGGIYLEAASPRIERCIVEGNAARIGAGIYARGASSAEITNCLVSRNTSTGFGAGMAFYSPSRPVVFNSTIIGNQAGGSGGGIFAQGSGTVLSLANCIVWNNAPDQIHKGLFSSVSATYSDVDGGYPGLGNRNEDPLFSDPARADYTLSAPSPCRDTGTSSGAPDRDLNGIHRPLGAGFDLGAYEYAFTDLLLEGLLAGGSYHSSTNIIVLNNSTIPGGQDVTLSAALDTTIKQGFRHSLGARLTVKNIDDDGLSNAWEMDFFGHLDQGPAGNPDGDWMINYWEYLFGFNPLNNDQTLGRNEDYDNDGFSNHIESVFGSDPAIAADKPDLPGPGAYYAYDALGRITSITRIK